MTFHITQPVLFRHCDPAGIVFYPRYFEMVNDTVEAFFASIDYPFHDMHKTHGVPTVEICASFKKASRHGDVLDLSLTPTRVGGASLDLAVTCTCAKEVRFVSEVTLVRVSNEMKSVRWPDAVRARLSSHINSELEEVANG